MTKVTECSWGIKIARLSESQFFSMGKKITCIFWSNATQCHKGNWPTFPILATDQHPSNVCHVGVDSASAPHGCHGNHVKKYRLMDIFMFLTSWHWILVLMCHLHDRLLLFWYSGPSLMLSKQISHNQGYKMIWRYQNDQILRTILAWPKKNS